MQVLTPLATKQLTRLADLNEGVASIFLTQWDEATSRYAQDDWFDRIEAHCRFLETHEWDGLKWVEMHRERYM